MSASALLGVPPRIFKVGPLFSNGIKKGGRYSAARSRKEGWEDRQPSCFTCSRW